MKFKDVPIGSEIRFVSGSRTYTKFDSNYVVGVVHGDNRRFYIKDDAHVEEIVEGGDGP